MISIPQIRFRFSGHESFSCRYAWLPKAVNALRNAPRIFGDEDHAIAELGVGKNMVRAIKFWVQATQIAALANDGGLIITPFGETILGPAGLDRFLEDRRTLWLLHWKLLSHVDEPLFAWDYMFNRWTSPEIARTDAVTVFEREAGRIERKLSRVTLEQHFDVFLHTYSSTRSVKGEILEDNLDCPLVELALLKQIGDRTLAQQGQRREAVFAFNRDPKPDITPELFNYCLHEYWNTRRPSEETLSFRDISVAHGSVGQVFKLTETDIRGRLESLSAKSRGLFDYYESASRQQVVRGTRVADQETLLHEIYSDEGLIAEPVRGRNPSSLRRLNVTA